MAFRSAANAVGTTGTKPAGVVSGDILVAHIIDEGNHTITPPASGGWTQIDNARDAGLIVRYASFWKLAGGSEPSTYAWTITGATYTEINIAAFSGRDTTTPINAHGLTDAVGNTATPSIPSVTTTVANTDLSVGLSEWFGKDWSGFTPTGFSFDTGESTSGALDSASFHKAQAASGATGTTAVTWSSASAGNPHSVTVVALAPAGGASTTQTLTSTARITASTSKTLTSTARITKTGVQKTLTSTARIGLITPKTLTSTARITATTPRTLTSTARITKTGVTRRSARRRASA
jgi:hypothetical protein